MKNFLPAALSALALAAACLSPAAAQGVADGSKEHPLRVLLIPADGVTETGTKADYAPVFNAISRTTGLHFDLKVGQSYGAVVEGMCNQLADIAFLGPVSYVQASKRGCAQLLAVTYQAMGLLPGSRRSGRYDPGSFWSGDNLGLSDGFRLGGEIAVHLP